MKRAKRLAAFLLAALLLTLLIPALGAEGLGNFTRSRTYSAGQFPDVSSSDWFAGSVAGAYELGLMNGVGESFAPKGSLTVGEALALAARLHHIYHGGDGVFTQGDPWYRVYEDYALANRIVTAGNYPNCAAQATRAQFAAILANALPASELREVNSVAKGAIPDVVLSAPYADAVYTLYRAGVLTGGDAKGSFFPDSSIDRASAAAIVSRMADPALRKTFTLTLNSGSYAYLAGDVCRAVLQTEPAASPQYAYVLAYEDLSGDPVVLVNVCCKTAALSHEVVLFNQSTGDRTRDPAGHYLALAGQSAGRQKLLYQDLGAQVQTANLQMLDACASIMKGNGNTASGCFLDREALAKTL